MWPESLNNLAAWWLPRMADVTWQGTVATLLVWCICRLLPSLSAGTRCWLWRLVYVKVLLAFVWPVAVTLPVLPPHPPGVRKQSNVAGSGGRTVALHSPSPSGQPYAAATSVQGGRAGTMLQSLDLTAWLLLLWAAGAGASLYHFGRRWRGREAFGGSCRSEDERDVRALCRSLCDRMGIVRAPSVRIVEQQSTPALAGIFRPSILLPLEAIRSCAVEERAAILAHELAHLKRRDLWWSWVPQIAHALFYFHPALWLAHGELYLAQEIACDELAMAVSEVPAQAYGQALIRFAFAARSDAGDRRPLLALTTSVRTVRRRLHALAHNARPCGSARRTAAPMLVCSAVALVPWRLSAQESVTDGAALPSMAKYEVRARGGIVTADQVSPADRLPQQGVSLGGLVVHAAGTGNEQFWSNAVLRLQVSTRDRRNLLLVQRVDPVVEAVDDQGRRVEGSALLRMTTGAFLDQDDPYERVFLRLPDRSARSLRSVAGNLLVSEGRVHALRFDTKALRPGSERRSGSASVTLDRFESASGGSARVDLHYSGVQAADSAPSVQAGDGNLLENDVCTAVAEGTDGKVYFPGPLREPVDRKKAFRIPLSGGSPGQTQRLFTFSGIPPDKVRLVTVYLVERPGGVTSIPFRLTNVRLQPANELQK